MQWDTVILATAVMGGLLATTVWLAFRARERERARAASEAELQDVLDHAVDAIEITAPPPDRRVLYANHAWRTMFGYGRHEPIVAGSEAMVIPTQAAAYRAMRERLLGGDGGTTDTPTSTPSSGETFEGVFLTRAGKRIVVSARANVKRSPGDGSVQAVRSILRDVTAQRQIEEAQARLVATFEATTDFVALTTRAGRTQYLNHAGKRLVGMKETDELASINLSEFFTVDSRRHFTEFAVPAAIRDGTWQGESTISARDGREIPVSVVVVAHESARGGVWFLSTIMRDMTVQRHRERELVVLVETAQAMGDAPDEAGACQIAVERLCAATGWPYAEVWMPAADASDDDGPVLHRVGVWRREDVALSDFTALMGHFQFARGQDLPGRVWDTRRPLWVRDLDEVAGDTAPARVALLSATGLRSAVAVPVVAENQVVATLNFHMPHLGDDDAFLVRLVAVVAAQLGMIIVRKHAESELHGEWKRLDRMKSEFVSTVSHELRTPLTAIRGALGLLSGGVVGRLGTQATELVRVALSNSDRLIRLINDLLDLDKIAAGKLELRLEPLAPTDVVRAAVDGIQAMAHEYKIALVDRVTTEAAFPGDRDRVIQVLTNLLSNAIKFSPSGSTVTLSVTLSVTAPERHERTRTPVVRFAVENPGRGISDSDMERLFRRFQQLDSSDNRHRGGTGLGLAISKSIVEQHGGRIGVESEPDVRTVFWVELPAPVAAGSAPLELFGLERVAG